MQPVRESAPSVGGRRLLQYRGASLPLIHLENHIAAQPPGEVDRLFVIVFEIHSREIGVIAPSLEDIRDVAMDVDTATLREPGVVGSIVIDNRATRLLDVLELAIAAIPNCFTPHAEEPPPLLPNTAPTVLLAADTS